MVPHYKYRCHRTGEIYVIAWDEDPYDSRDTYLGAL